MLTTTAQSPLSSDSHIQRPKSNRKALQPKNTPATPPPIIINSSNQNPKLKKSDWIEISLFDDSNKENIHPNNGEPIKIEPFDASLAEELSAIRKKLDRLKVDKDKTDNMLKQRDLMLDMQMKDLLSRGEVQKQLEIEMDRLYRLKELRFPCMRISPIRSLREKEQEKKIKEDQTKETKVEDRDDKREDTSSQSTSSDVVKEN